MGVATYRRRLCTPGRLQGLACWALLGQLRVRARHGHLLAPNIDSQFAGSCQRVDGSSLTPEEFVEQFVTQSRPVVFTGLGKGKTTWVNLTLTALVQRLGNAFPVKVAKLFRGGRLNKLVKTVDLASRKRLTSLGGFARALGKQAPPHLYLNQADLLVAPGGRNNAAALASAHAFLRELNASGLAGPAQIGRAGFNLTGANVWATAGAAVAGLHYDMADNMLSVLAGEKEVLLFRPAEVTCLHYEHVTDATLGGEPPGQSEPQPTKPQASARPLEDHLRPDSRYQVQILRARQRRHLHRPCR
ncbi:unnamed protein product [Polarella glacialis]|uniref:Cupin-like domain-containing protein n=1 Tax=Polarella glacialis TaxID=89957 RepID=A0A813J039_POLGL|nr:unnamed protein product [Polarella glacialis]